MNASSKTNGRWVICLDNTGYSVSLEKGKVYRRVPDRSAANVDLVRVVDESGDDYLYSTDRFASIALTRGVRQRLTENEPIRPTSRAHPMKRPAHRPKSRNVSK